MQKTNRKKNKNKTNLAPLKTQKPLKNLRKINKNQQITSTHFDQFSAPKTSQNGTPKRPKNEQKNNTKKEQKQRAMTTTRVVSNNNQNNQNGGGVGGGVLFATFDWEKYGIPKVAIKFNNLQLRKWIAFRCPRTTRQQWSCSRASTTWSGPRLSTFAHTVCAPCARSSRAPHP